MARKDPNQEVRDIRDQRLRNIAGKERLNYPFTDRESYQGRVIFTARKTEGQNIFNKSLDALVGGLDAYVETYVESQIPSTGDGGVINKALVKFRDKTKEDILGTDKSSFKSKLPHRIGSGRKCTLYLPMSMGFQDRVSYNNVDLRYTRRRNEKQALQRWRGSVLPALKKAFFRFLFWNWRRD